jgi:hypothetical protein
MQGDELHDRTKGGPIQVQDLKWPLAQVKSILLFKNICCIVTLSEPFRTSCYTFIIDRIYSFQILEGEIASALIQVPILCRTPLVTPHEVASTGDSDIHLTRGSLQEAIFQRYNSRRHEKFNVWHCSHGSM